MEGLNNPYIVRLYQVIVMDTYVALAMEFVSETNLGQLLDDLYLKKEKLTMKTVRKYFGQMVRAVEYLHRKGIAHR